MNHEIHISETLTAGITATGTLRSNLTWQHMHAARLFARQTKVLEDNHAGKPFGDFFEDIFAYAEASVLCAAASVEAFANAVFADRRGWFANHDPEVIDLIWNRWAERESALEKLALALTLRKAQPLDKGAAPFQDAATLFELRHKLMHFKLEFDNEDGDHKRLSRRLETILPKSPFLQTDPNLFPRAWATSGSADWAVETAKATIEEVSKRLGYEIPETVGK